MAWTTPFTPVTNTIITSSSWNTYGRDNLTYLHDNSWQLISSQVLTVAATAITFSPSGNYKNLKVVCVTQSDTNAISTINATFNGDTGNNYDFIFFGKDSQASSASIFRVNSAIGSSSIKTGFIAASGIANIQSLLELIIPGWNDTNKHKSILSSQAYFESTVEYDIVSVSGWWRNTSAINTIALTASANHFAIGSSFYLYGG